MTCREIGLQCYAGRRHNDGDRQTGPIDHSPEDLLGAGDPGPGPPGREPDDASIRGFAAAGSSITRSRCMTGTGFARQPMCSFPCHGAGLGWAGDCLRYSMSTKGYVAGDVEENGSENDEMRSEAMTEQLCAERLMHAMHMMPGLCEDLGISALPSYLVSLTKTDYARSIRPM